MRRLLCTSLAKVVLFQNARILPCSEHLCYIFPRAYQHKLSFGNLYLCCSCLYHAEIIQGQWDINETQQETGNFCGGGVSRNASAWLADDPFVSLSGDAGESVTIRFVYSNTNPNGATQFESSIDSLEDFNVTLVANATIPDSGNLCVDTTLPPLVVGAIGIIYVAALNPETGANVSSCATIEYIPESVEGQIVQGTNTTYRNFYCSNSTDLPVTESSCDCHCHDADGELPSFKTSKIKYPSTLLNLAFTEHCTGECSDEEIEVARDQCTSQYESNNPSAECDCHCHGAEGMVKPTKYIVYMMLS